MARRLVLLHGWGADANDLRPLGETLQSSGQEPLELISFDAPELHPQGSGRQWYGLFPAQWEAVPQAVDQLKHRLLRLEGGASALKRTILFGFSQGGAMALHAGCELPLAGVISCSGYPHPEWHPPSLHPPVLVMHGRDDTVVPYQAMDRIQNQLNGDRCRTLSFQNGHTIPAEIMQPIRNFIVSALKEST